MTRQEAKNVFVAREMDSDIYYTIPKISFDDFIDTIYDDFENQKCINCKFDTTNKQTSHKDYCEELLIQI